MTSAVSVPVIADADTGYGEVPQVMPGGLLVTRPSPMTVTDTV